ncbi:MAG: hypothetical protein WBA25_11195 [Jannaschia sp.]
MTRTILAALLATALAGPAAALSCLAPSVEGSFRAADESDAQYAMAVGTLTPLPGEAIPAPSPDPNQREGYVLQTRFEGNLATLDGFDRPATFDVAVEVECAGAWCGGVPVGAKLLFLERREDGNVLVEGPCPRFALAATPENMSGAVACVRGEACAAP